MSTVTTRASKQVADLSIAELESLIRRVVRDEIESVLAGLDLYEGPTVIEPGSPLYQSLIDIQQRAREGRLKFYTYEEVFGE
jgi:hypothetical protein